MDWADKIAQAFLDNLDSSDLDIIEGPAAPFQALAAALRKAKADGMREAAKTLERAPNLGAMIFVAGTLQTRAYQIEKGQK